MDRHEIKEAGYTSWCKAREPWPDNDVSSEVENDYDGLIGYSDGLFKRYQ